MSTQLKHPSTVMEVLAPFRLPESSYEECKPLLKTASWLLGSPLNGYSIFSLSKTAVNTITGIFSRCLHVPTVDLHLTQVTPALRRTAFTTSSAAFKCYYCTGHGIVMGDFVRGGIEKQLIRGCPRPRDTLDPNASHLTEAEASIIRLANCVSQRDVTPTYRELVDCTKAVRQNIGADGLETIKGILCFAAYMNTMMSFTGVELEEDVRFFTEDHAQRVEMQLPKEISVPANQTSNSNTGNTEQKTAYSFIRYALDCAQVVPFAVRILLIERRLYAGIPTEKNSLNDWLVRVFGDDVPKFFNHINNIEFKRAICFSLREVLLPDLDEKSDEDRVWNLEERCVLMYTYGQLFKNEDMCMVAEKLCKDVSKEELRAFANRRETIMWSAAVKNAREAVMEQTQGSGDVSLKTLSSLVETCSPKGIIELSGLLGWFCLWHRVTLLYSDADFC